MRVAARERREFAALGPNVHNVHILTFQNEIKINFSLQCSILFNFIVRIYNFLGALATSGNVWCEQVISFSTQKMHASQNIVRTF